MDNDNFGKVVFFGFILALILIALAFARGCSVQYLVCPECTNECYDNLNYNYCPYCGHTLEEMPSGTN